jgi:predicted transcriptional regulator
MTAKTTIYLPEELKRGVEREAHRLGASEAEVIRRAIAAAVTRPRPRAGIVEAEPFADRVDELFDGFGLR